MSTATAEAPVQEKPAETTSVAETTTAKEIKLEKKCIVELFEKLGYAEASAWTPARLGKKIAALPLLLKDDADMKTRVEKLSDRDKGLFQTLIDAVNTEATVELTEPALADGEAPKEQKKKGGKKPVKEKTDKPVVEKKETGPGVIATIISILEKATEDKPVTKEDILVKLSKAFPDRETDGMKKTINIQVPSRLVNDKKLCVKTVKEEGKYSAYYIKK